MTHVAHWPGRVRWSVLRHAVEVAGAGYRLACEGRLIGGKGWRVTEIAEAERRGLKVTCDKCLGRLRSQTVSRFGTITQEVLDRIEGLERKAADLSEKDFQADVIRFAKANGWRVYHTFTSKRSEPGYPDLTLVRGSRLIFAELKTESGKATAEQSEWLDAIRAARVPAYLWRPSDWPAIREALAAGAAEGRR
ncbi:MAG TPA: hypothetical protein VEA69_21020 [Tepidisphaeraceae bacterium]|nr:hypothetical protein [Tepidisphaeraceae bacterium]